MALKLLNLVKNNKFQELAFFIGLALSRLVWFAGSRGVLAQGDIVISANPFQFWTSLFSPWSGNELGMFNDLLPRIFYPEWAIIGLLNGIGLSPPTAQMVFVVLLSFVAAFSIFYLARQLFPEKKDRRVAFFATLAYIFSPNLIVDSLHSSISWLPFFTFVPLMVLIALKAIKEKNLKYSLALAFVAYFSVSGFPNPVWLLSTVIAMVAFGYFQAIRAHRLKFYTSFLAITGGIFMAANLFWLLPLSSSMREVLEAGILRPPSLEYNPHSTFLEVSRLLGKGGFYTGYIGIPFIPYAAPYLHNPFFIIVSFVPTILAFGALALRRRCVTVTFLGTFTLVILILATGHCEWFGGYYVFLITKVPVLKSFHESARWTHLAVLPFSLLIGTCLGEISRRLSSILLHWGVIGILILAILLASLPLVNGSVVDNWLATDTRGVSIPASYTETNDWLRQQEGPFSVLALPSRTTYLVYNWGLQGGAVFLSRSIIVPTIIGQALNYLESPSSSSVQSLYGTLYSDSNPYFGKLLAKHGIKYLLVETNIVSDFFGPNPDHEETLSLLSKQKGIREIKRFGDIIIFENDYFQGWVIATHSAYLITTSGDFPADIVWELDKFIQQDPRIIENPSSVVWEARDFSREKRISAEQPIMIGEELSIRATAEGKYLTKEVYVPITSPVSAGYLLLEVVTNKNSTIAVSVFTDKGPVWLDASNPTTMRANNHYSAPEGTTLIFALPQSPIKGVNIMLSNSLNTAYQGPLEASIAHVRMVNDVAFVPPQFTANTLVMVDQGAAIMRATAEGTLVSKEMRIIVAPPVSARYLFINVQTTEVSTVAINVQTEEGTIWLDAINPTPSKWYNHYSSPEGTTLAFRLPKSPIREITILLDNMMNRAYKGQLEASIDYVRMANSIGGSEVIAALAPEKWYNGTSIVLERDIDSALVEPLRAMGSSTQSPSPLSITEEGDWAYSIQVASTEPFILSLTQSFDKGWRLQAPGASPIHFKTEGYGNAWLFPQGYQGEIQLYYAHTSLFKWLGIGTAFCWVTIALYFLTQSTVGRLRRKKGAN